MAAPTATDTPANRRAGTSAGALGRWWVVALLWGAIGAGLLVLQAAASESPHLWDGWTQFDGPEYLSIVADGYQQRQLVWFPALPLLIHAVDLVVGEPRAAAVLVSAAAGLGSALLFWRWTADRALSERQRMTGVAVMLVYPYAWFLYGVVYADALFLVVALGAFLLLERDRVWWSALLGACATAARPSGFALTLGLVVLWLERTGALGVPGPATGWVHRLRLPVVVHRDRWTPRSWIPLLSLGGLAGFMLYQWIAWGSPFLFVSEQSNYHEEGVSSLVKQQYFDAWTLGFDGRHLATTTAQAVILVLVLASVPAVGRRFGWGYGIYVAALVAFPLVSVSTFMGVGRYLLPAFPCFALAGKWLEGRRLLRWAWLSLSAVAMFVMAAGFARSWYLA